MADLLDRLKVALGDGYTIERELGVGGMATVYLAEDIRHHRKVAVKVLRPDLAAALGPERFLQEIEIAAQLQHPNILPLYDSGEADGFLFYIMPHIEGPSLREKLVKEGELPIADAVRILRDVVDALTEAHAHGVVHRDIKPENILLSGRHALVTDFGVAKAVSEATSRAKLTTAGVALGTPAYMAPEQASADPHLDQRVDIYAVGAVAYELLTGRPVFMGTTPQMILSAHMTEPPQPVTKHRDTVPAALESVVMRCLEKRPADRWQTAEELLPQLEALVTPSGGVTPTDTRPVAATVRGRHWLVLGAVAAVVLIVLGFVGVRLLRHDTITVTVSNIRPVTSGPDPEWIPALSPDGSQVAFSASSDRKMSLVVRSTRSGVEGGQLRPTAGVGSAQDEQHPAWSPDGESIRFVACAAGSDDCTWMEAGRLGGSVRALDLPRQRSWASWSPDDSRVAFIAGGDSLFVHSLTDGTTSLLAVNPSGDPDRGFWPVWSPDGRWIAYMYGGGWFNSLFPTQASLWLVDAEGGEPVRLTSDGFIDMSPAWLNADHLLFSSNRDGPREVYVIEVTASGPRGEPRKVAGVADARGISYSIAGQTLAFTRLTTRRNIWSYPLDSGTVSIADGYTVTRGNGIIRAHDLSPDGTWIVYGSDLDHAGNTDLYTRPLERGEPTLIAEGPFEDTDPRWSPDGAEIAYTVQASAPNRLMVVSADGRNPVQLDSAPSVWRPSWSPSGLDLAFMSDKTGRIEAWVVSREAVGGAWGEAAQVTDLGCWPYDWVPDDSGILCAVGMGDQGWEGLAIVSRDGEVLWRYDPATAGLVLTGHYSVFSRDGSVIYTGARRAEGGVGIWAIPVHGGEPRLVVAFDDPDVTPVLWMAVGPDRLYLTVQQTESDIWVADVEVER